MTHETTCSESGRKRLSDAERMKLRRHYYKKRLVGDYYEYWVGDGKGNMDFRGVVKAKDIKSASMLSVRNMSTLALWARKNKMTKMIYEDEIYAWVEESDGSVPYVEMIIRIEKEKGEKLVQMYGLGNLLRSYAR